ncbi:carbohydrate ABC transporter permease [Georgenia sp. SUBG003]|uniref:carbohydrate ABC transporter permease n=1 Tax=Georgenia sp. SUBG003 TaxID=1497974 RepID=UPI003AB46AEF
MLLFSTYVVPTVAIVIIWSNLYAPGYGPIDNVLALAGIGSPGWLSNPSTALVSLVIFNVWQMLGYYVVLLVAGLTQIPEEVYEAARLDGAGAVRQTVSITVPLLRNTLVFGAARRSPTPSTARRSPTRSSTAPAPRPRTSPPR